ncbi:hypothetical protein, partial [Plasmodium yoelii yoelii]
KQALDLYHIYNTSI